MNYAGLVASGFGHKEYEARWQKPGDENFTNVPSFQYPVNQQRDAFYSIAEINVLKGDHVRLQYINLSYTLRKARAIKSLEQLQFYVNASNLGILWRANKFQIDPDSPVGPSIPKSFAAGFRMNF